MFYNQQFTDMSKKIYITINGNTYILNISDNTTNNFCLYIDNIQITYYNNNEYNNDDKMDVD